MKLISMFTIIICIGMFAGCGASTPPNELINARQAYQQASAGQAAQLAPAELHKAHEALTIAEKSFQDNPKSYRTRDLAYVADRQAKMAEALATISAENAAAAKANKDYQSTQTEIMKNAKQDLAASERSSAVKSQQLATQNEIVNNTKQDLAASERSNVLKSQQLVIEQNARLAAENRAVAAQADLARLGEVKEEARGLVVTLSGSVLFASNKSTLLPDAKDRLNQVTEALMATKERKLLVEGHTDSQGSAAYNLELSQMRADAVRSYIISRGYGSDLIEAKGIGEVRPVSKNSNAEGRANNRRVEIIIEHPSSSSQSINE